MESADLAGYSTWFPRIRRRAVRRGRRVQIVEPLFPRYFFVELCERWFSLSWLRGVSHVLQDGERPIVLAGSAAEELRGRVGPDGFYSSQPPKFDRGQKVLATAGPLAGLVGRFEYMTSSGREAALFEILGATRIVSFDEGSLAAT